MWKFLSPPIEEGKYRELVHSFIHRGRWNIPSHVQIFSLWSELTISSSSTSRFSILVSFNCISGSLLLRKTTLLSRTTWQRISTGKPPKYCHSPKQWVGVLRLGQSPKEAICCRLPLYGQAQRFHCDLTKTWLASYSSLAEVVSSWERSTEST